MLESLEKVWLMLLIVLFLWCFVKIDDNLSGLVHISQLSKKFIKSPSEVVKEGQRG